MDGRQLHGRQQPDKQKNFCTSLALVQSFRLEFGIWSVQLLGNLTCLDHNRLALVRVDVLGEPAREMHIAV